MNLKNCLQSPIPSRAKRIAKIVAAVIIILLILCIIIWRMFVYTPSAYRPTVPMTPGQVSPYLTHKLGPEMYNNIQLDKPFRIIVEQTGINDVIAGWPWPIQLEGVSISMPMVIFTPETITLMGPIKFDIFGKKPIVISIIFAPELDKEGLLTLNLKHVKAGALNITPLAKSITAKIYENQLQGVEPAGDNQWMFDLRDALSENKPFEPIYPSYEDYIRVRKLELLDQQLNLDFIPVKR